MISPLVWLAIATATYFYIRTSDRTRTSGSVLLQAGVPYRVEMYWPKNSTVSTRSISDPKEIEAIREQMARQGGSFPDITETPAGATLVSRVTPPTPVPLTFGTPVLGPAVLVSVTRLDGKDWNAP